MRPDDTPVVLLTGAPDRVDVFSAALTDVGCQCITAQAGRDRVDGPGPSLNQVDVYVQLPLVVETSPGSVVRQVRDLLAQGLVARFDSAEAAVPLVRDGGMVVLVAGNTPGEGRDVADDRKARYSLLRVLRHAIVSDTAGRGIRAVVLDTETSPDDVVATVLGAPTAREKAIADLLTRDTDMAYDDWRLELLSLVTDET